MPWGAGGVIGTTDADGNKLLIASNEGNGGVVRVYNKTGEAVVNLRADEYGKGVVYAGNRIGMGRTLQPGP